MFGQKRKSKLSHQSGSKEQEDDYKASGVDNDVRESRETYDVYFLGIVPDINMGNSWSRDKEAQLVDRVEEAQIEGKLPIVGRDDDKVKVNVSKHGIKVIDVKGQEVLQRHPLHTLAQVIQYNDGHGTGNIVLKIGQVNKTVFSCYVFQCLSETQAQKICHCVRAVFDTFTEKNG